MWPHHHPLLPKEPYERALVRFWAKFAEEKGIAFWMFAQTTGEEQAKAKKDSMEMLKTLEEHGNLGNNTFFGGEEIGMVDLAFGSLIYWLQVIEQIVEVKIFEANSFPRLYKWFNSFKDVPIIKNNVPDQNQLYLHFKKYRNRQMEATSA
uniref:glutathione transferase n=2 Tax=Chenopodium quinoa TaxID=63459 RepID=A0A803MUB3_CHEQI